MKSEQVHSAGGVLVTLIANMPYTVVLHRRHPDEWRLPKGKLRLAETSREAAVREVAEETGITSTARDFLGQTEYEYVEPASNRNVRKQVRYYLMPVARRQTITVESATFDRGLWVPLVEAERLLTFENERRILREASACVNR